MRPAAAEVVAVWTVEVEFDATEAAIDRFTVPNMLAIEKPSSSSI